MKTKTVYSYDPTTGEYIGEAIAHEAPRQPGKYLIPAHATESAPPEIGEHEATVWDGGEWTIREDWRSHEGYINGEPTVIEALGPLPEGWSDTPPPPTFDEAKAMKKAEIADARWNAEVGGIEVGGIPIATDDRSKSLLKAAYDEAKEDPSFCDGWKGADGVFREVDAATVITVYNALRQHVRTCFAREAQLIALVEAIPPDAPDSVEQVQAIHWDM